MLTTRGPLSPKVRLRRSVGGTTERKRVTHQLGLVTTRGKRPPADIKAEAERHMATTKQRHNPSRSYRYSFRFRGGGLSCSSTQGKLASTTGRLHACSSYSP